MRYALMEHAKVSINGVVTGGDQAQVSVFDRGFLYGDSVFEVYRTYGGMPFGELEHLERLARSAAQLMIPLPVGLDLLAREVKALLAAVDHEDTYVRVILTRGQGPLTYDPTTASDPMRVIIAAPVNKPPKQRYKEGIEVAIMIASRPTDDSRAAGAKASNYLANLLAVHEAKQSGAQEAILLGRQGQLLEGASSNLFIVKDGALFTPIPEPGILVGITRRTVLQVAEASGIEVHEQTLMPDALFGADEAFITSSIREVMPVVRADGKAVGKGVPGSMTKALMQGYTEAVRRATGTSI